jgi:hypothetical protein
MTMAKYVNRWILGQSKTTFQKIRPGGKLAFLIIVALAVSSAAFADETTIIFAKEESFLQCIGFVKNNPGQLHIFDLEPWQEVSAYCDRNEKIFHYQADEYGHLEVYVPFSETKIGVWRTSIDDPQDAPECQTARDNLGW